MIGAFVLIGLGVIFLLVNFGYVGWSVFRELWRFWPLLIVFTGLQLITGRNPVGRFVTGVAGLFTLLYVLAVSLYVASPALRPTLQPLAPYLPNAVLRTDRSTPDASGSSQVVSAAEGAGVAHRMVNAHIGAAGFALTDDGNFANAFTVDSPEGEAATLTSQRDGDATLTISMDTPSLNIFQWTGRKYSATIGQVGIPTSLMLDVGASEFDLLLDEVPLREATVTLGAGSGELSFGSRSVPDSLSLEVGAGSLAVMLPADVTITYRYTVGAGRVDIDGDGAAVGSGSGTLAGAGKTVTLAIDAGAGSVTVERK